MKRRRLGQSGIEVSAIGLGCWGMSGSYGPADEHESEALGRLLTSLAEEGRAVLIVEHDTDLVLRVCHTVHVLDFGQIIASGTPDHIKSDPAVVNAYLGTP